MKPVVLTACQTTTGTENICFMEPHIVCSHFVIIF